LLDHRQTIVDGGELTLDVVELLVEVGDELVEGSLEVTIVAIGSHGSGLGSNWSPRYQCQSPVGRGRWVAAARVWGRCRCWLWGGKREARGKREA